ncbi:MAG: hypothetical protein ACKOW9_00730 [Candidatus Paceibacterota bacterium]
MKGLFKTEKKDDFVLITVNNILSTEIENEFLSKHPYPEIEEVSQEFEALFGTQALSTLQEYWSLRNVTLYVLKNKLEKSNPGKTIGFQYIPELISTDDNKVQAIVGESNLDLSDLQNFSLQTLASDWFSLTEIAVEESFPSIPIESLNDIILNDQEMLEIFQNLAQHPSQPDINDMPIDRRVLNAVTILTSRRYNTYNSCQGHERFDAAGLEGAVTPSIHLKLNSEEYRDLTRLLNTFKNELNLNNISLLPIFKEYEVNKVNNYVLDFGDRVTLASLSGANRSNYLEWCLGNLNLFAKFVAELDK